MDRKSGIRPIVSQRGFSMLDMMLTLVIFSILLVIAIPATNDWRVNQKVGTVSTIIAHDFANARLKSVYHNRAVLIQFDPVNHFYTMYLDQDNDGPDPSEVIKIVDLAQLDGNVIFGVKAATGIDGSDISGPVNMGQAQTVTFHPNGDVINSGAVYLMPKYDPGYTNNKSRAISISDNGRIQTWRYRDNTWRARL